MSNQTNQKYVDHPAPSVGLITIYLLAISGMIVAMPALFEIPSAEVPPCFLPTVWFILILGLTILCFYSWPIYATYYTLTLTGIQVRYGPWIRDYRWSDFETVYWQKGMFATRIGWPSVTPCVRLSDGILLKRRAKRFGLYLTPNDPRAFIQRIAEFAPELTKEMIM